MDQDQPANPTLRDRAATEAPVRHTIGLDLGTSSLRLEVAHFDARGLPIGAPAGLHLPHSERGGYLPTVLQLSAAAELLAYGCAAIQRLSQPMTGKHEETRFVAEFKPCVGQAEADLAALGRPEKTRRCTNAGCLRPGWAWSIALQYCGYCGAPLTDATERWHPVFPYTQDEALKYASLLLGNVRPHLELRVNEPLRRETGWQVVAGVPVHWQAPTRARYLEVLAGAFPSAALTLVSEPEAALRYYAHYGQVSTAPGWTLVVDFGAGTTDLVLGKVLPETEGGLLGEVHAYGERYGGADFDLLLSQYAAAELGVTLNAALLSRWKLEAQRWKEAFSDAAQIDPVAETGFVFPVPVGDRGCDFQHVVMNRQRFAHLAGELVDRFRSVLERGLRHFGVGGEEVVQVILAGGGSQWYFVRDAVRDLCPRAHVLGGVEPTRAIARGLALAPAALSLPEAPRKPPPAPDPGPSPEPEPEGMPDHPSPEEGKTLDGGQPTPPEEEPESGGDRRQIRKTVQMQAGEPYRATHLRTFRVTGEKLHCAALSPDGTRVATGTEAGVLKWGKGSILFWDAVTGSSLGSIPGEPCMGLSFSPDGDQLAFASCTGTTGLNGRLTVIHASSGERCWSQSHPASPQSVCFSPRGDRIATTHFSTEIVPRVRLWEAATGKACHQFPDVASADAAVFSAEGNALVVTTEGGLVRIYRLRKYALLAQVHLPRPEFHLKWGGLRKSWLPASHSPVGRKLAVGSFARTPSGLTGRLFLFDWPGPGEKKSDPITLTFQELVEQGAARILDGHSEPVSQVCFSPDGRWLASGSHDGSVNLWEVETGTLRQALTSHTGRILALAFSRDGSRMMSASQDGTVRVWSLESGAGKVLPS